MVLNLLSRVILLLYSGLFILIAGLLPIAGLSQTSSGKGLFDTDEVLEITLSGTIREALNDRTGIPKKYAAVLSYNKEDNSIINTPVELQTRGNFRRMKENCNYPPLWIHFPIKGGYETTVFREQRKTKLVMPCVDDDYIIREWLVYKLYNLISPLSFRVRLVKVKTEDPKIKKASSSFYGILLEEEKQMARRSNMKSVAAKLKPEQTKAEDFLTMSVFEYLIGNTDWSVQYLHNVKLLVKNSTEIPVTVPYDFDHSGIVNAPYARPAEELQMSSTRERRYRGYCVQNLKTFEAVIARYNNLKTNIYKLYSDCKLLDQKYIKSTLQFLDQFYETINNPKLWQKAFSYPCDKNGTGNIVIKGLKEE
ncbi:MAG: hypothetical protein ABIU11_01980 [Chitinophagaceae bacterium]